MLFSCQSASLSHVPPHWLAYLTQKSAQNYYFFPILANFLKEIIHFFANNLHIPQKSRTFAHDFVSLKRFNIMQSCRLYLFLLPALVALLAVACQEPAYINGPGDNLFNQDSIIPIPDPEPTPAPEGIVIPEGALNVYQVRDTCAKLANGAVSDQKYYIYGWVKSFNESKHLDGSLGDGNAFF